MSGSFHRFVEPMLHNKKSTIINAFIVSLWHIFSMFSIYAVKKAVDYITAQDYQSFLNLVIFFSCYGIVHQVMNYILCLKYFWYDYDIKNRIYKSYIPSLIRLDNNTYEGIGTGKMITYFKEGIDKRTDLLVGGLLQGVKLIISLTFSIYIILSLGFRYFVVFLVAAVFFNYLSIKIKRYGVPRRSEKYETQADLTRSLVRIIMSKNTILETNSEAKEIDTIISKNLEVKRLHRALRVTEHIGVSMSVILPFFLNVVFLYIGGNYVFDLSLTLGEFVGISTLLTYMSGFMREMGIWFEDILKNYISVEKLWRLIDETPQVIGYDSGNEFVHQKGNIEFINVRYAYDRGTEVFNDFSLTIAGGSKTALVGMSGSGKSTLMKLIAGYLHPLEGTVRVDGQLLPKVGSEEHVSLKSYYKHIGYLTQEPSVFDGTVYENLIYATQYEPTQPELINAIQLAKCEFIYDLPYGLDTQIGEKGIKLSGGQRQRLAIAKIFLKNPQIILLDEPTSALDSFSEEEVTLAFDNLFRDRTVIVIAHRLQTVKKADRILVLEAGKVKEEGRHEELVQKGGIYAKMLELQSGF